MKVKKLLVLLVSVTLVFSGFLVVQAKADSMETAAEQIERTQENTSSDNVLISKSKENCIIVTRATGEIEVYPLEEILEEANIISNDEVVTVNDVLTINNSLDYINYGISNDIILKNLSRSFNWDVKGNVISYSTTSLTLNKGDAIDFLIATNAGYSCEIGLMDRTDWKFYSSGYFGGNEGGSISSGFTTAVNFSSVSFAINNLRTETTNFSGSYTAPR